MSSLKVIKICPSTEELESASEYYCSEEACLKSGIKFKNQANLEMHLTRHHKFPPTQTPDNTIITREFHCPIANCTYNLDTGKGHSFSSRKYLKQHFQKVHAAKEFKCNECQKMFSTVVLRENHERTCGHYECPHCHYTYTSKESLSSHVRRKHNGNVSASGLKRNRLKGVNKTVAQRAPALLSTATTTTEIGIQTTTPPSTEQTPITAAEPLAVDEEDVSDSLVDNFCQTISYFDDDAFGCPSTGVGGGGGGCGAMSSIETQTDLLEDLALMSSLIYNSNDRHTQTCEEILTELLVSDIETQTMWSGITADCSTDLFVSTETQTGGLGVLAGENNSIQTQTMEGLFAGATSTSSTQT